MRGKKRMWILPLLLVIIALIMCIYGLMRGEADSIWHKAMQICMECIGLG